MNVNNLDEVNDDDIYIMVECIYLCHKSHYFQVAPSWIVDDDDIYVPKSDLIRPPLPTHPAIATWQRHRLKTDYNHNEYGLS